MMDSAVSWIDVSSDGKYLALKHMFLQKPGNVVQENTQMGRQWF